MEIIFIVSRFLVADSMSASWVKIANNNSACGSGGQRRRSHKVSRPSRPKQIVFFYSDFLNYLQFKLKRCKMRFSSPLPEKEGRL